MEAILTYPFRLVSPQWRGIVVFIWTILGACLISVLVTILWRQDHHTAHRVVLRRSCEKWGDFVENQFNNTAKNVRVLSNLIPSYYYKKSNNESLYDLSTFKDYIVNTLASRPMTSLIIYSPRVSHKSRSIMEARLGQCFYHFDLGPDFCCKAADEYMPAMLLSICPITQPGLFYTFKRGADLFSCPDFESIINRVVNGTPVALTKPLPLGNFPFPNLVQMFPVYRNGLDNFSNSDPVSRYSHIEGLVMTVYNFTFLKTSPTFKILDSNVDAQIVDYTISSQPIVLYDSDDKEEEAFNNTAFPFEAVLPIYFGDLSRRIEIRCRFRKDTFISSSAITWGAILSVALILSVFLLRTTVNLMTKLESDFKDMEQVRDRMKEAKLEAERASRAKGAFLTTMSHEIRTPMNGVIGMLNLLQQTALNATQRDYAETALTSGRALCLLINDILDFSKIEAERLELDAVDFNMRSEIDDVLALFVERDVHKQKVELAAFVADDVPIIVHGDALRVRQVLINLLSNAMKFTSEGHVFLVVRLARPGEEVVHDPSQYSSDMTPLDQSLEGSRIQSPVSSEASRRNKKSLSGCNAVHGPCSYDYISEHLNLSRCGGLYGSCQYGHGQPLRLIFSIEDTGMGIPKSAWRNLFRPFSQADLSTSRLHGGTGIGLCICQRLITKMGGNISFFSRPSVGTTFFFDIQVEAVESHEPCLGPPRACGGHCTAREPALFGLKVLVVDDRHVRAAVTISVLRRLGMRPMHCSDFDQIPRLLPARRSGFMSVPDSGPLEGKTKGGEAAGCSFEAEPSFCYEGPKSTLLPSSPPAVRGHNEYLEHAGQKSITADEGGIRGLSYVRRFSLNKPSRPAGLPLPERFLPERSASTGTTSERNHSSSVSVESRRSLHFEGFSSESGPSSRSSSGTLSPRANSETGPEAHGVRINGAEDEEGRAVWAVFVEEELLQRRGLRLEEFQSLVRLPEGPMSTGSKPHLLLLLSGESDGLPSSTGFAAMIRKPVRKSALAASLVPLLLAESANSSPKSRVTSPGSDASTVRSASGQSGAKTVSKFYGARGTKDSRDDVACLSYLKDKKLLVVDDNLINRKVIKKMLERYGAAVTAVDGGQKALEELTADHSYDIVFMDLQMPEMDGIEATHRIRVGEEKNGVGVGAGGKCRRVPILALTADVIAGTRERCLGAGMDFYMTKPIEEDQLVRAISTLFFTNNSS